MAGITTVCDGNKINRNSRDIHTRNYTNDDMKWTILYKYKLKHDTMCVQLLVFQNNKIGHMLGFEETTVQWCEADRGLIDITRLLTISLSIYCYYIRAMYGAWPTHSCLYYRSK